MSRGGPGGALSNVRRAPRFAKGRRNFSQTETATSSEPTATVVARLSLGVGLAHHFAGVSSAAIFLLAETTASRSTCSRVTFFVAYIYPTITAEMTE